jgi:uncharacterized protein
MLYLDTSLIVAALCKEATTARVQAWLTQQDVSHLAVSDWTLTEVSAALSINLRSGRIDLGQRATALALFNKLLTSSFTVLDVTRHHFLTAAKFADHQATGIRAGDALHLAIAAEQSATVCTLDHRMARGGPPLGVPTQLVA